MLEIFSSIGLGAITGFIGSLTTAYSNYKMKQMELADKDKDRAHEVALLKANTECMIAETQANIAVSKEETIKALEVGELNLLGETIRSEAEPAFHESYMKTLDKSWLGKFFVPFIALAFAIVECLKKSMRPGLTIYLLGASTWITMLSYEILNKAGMASMDADKALALFESVTTTIIYLTVSAVSWWMMDRKMEKFIMENIKIPR